MVQYKAGYKFVNGGVHAQVLDFPEAITCGADLDDARRMLGMAMLDMIETRLELGSPSPAGPGGDRPGDGRGGTALLAPVGQLGDVPTAGRNGGAVKREDLLRHLRRHGCRPLRERGHSVWVNPANSKRASIPRHREVNDYTASGRVPATGRPRTLKT